VINWAELDHSPSADEIIDYQLRLRLRDNPGGSAQYSNVGYLVLSRVIEAASGEEYEQYVKKHVLEPAGCYDMHIAHNFYEERYPNEVRYYGHDEGEVIPSYDNSGNMYPREYGGNNIRGLQGAGGWVASSAEMMRLVASIDGKDGVPDILSPKSIKAMRIPSREGGFGFGWARCSAKSNTLVRTGTMSGTCAYIEYNPKGYSFVLITNTSHYRGARFTQSAGNTIKEGIRRVKEFPENVDLFVAIPQPEEVQSDEKSEEAKE
jgi:CubicO group peptidase (beta-lactamase class C family)